MFPELIIFRMLGVATSTSNRYSHNPTDSGPLCSFLTDSWLIFDDACQYLRGINTDSSYRILSSGGGWWNCEHRIWICRFINGRLRLPIISTGAGSRARLLHQVRCSFNLIFEIHFSSLQRWSPSRLSSGCWLSAPSCFPLPFTYFGGCIAAMAPPTTNQTLVTIQFCRRCLRSLDMDNLRASRCNYVREILAIQRELWV